MNIIDKLNQQTIEELGKDIPEFSIGDTIKVHVKVTEGTRERIQVFEGVVIARKNADVNSAFTVRKMSFGEGVERVFPLYSPTIARIETVRRGDVRRAKLYYMRGRTGKAARIAEKADWAKKNKVTEAVAKAVKSQTEKKESDESTESTATPEVASAAKKPEAAANMS